MTKAKVSPVYEGRLAMTTRASVHVTSDAGHTFQATIHTSINASESPDLIDDLKNGRLNVVTDPESGNVYTLAVPVVVHNPERKTFLLVLPNTLRHQEFEQRQRVLQQVEADSAFSPAYVRDFQVIFDLAKLDTVETVAEAAAPPAQMATDSEIMDLESIRAELDETRARLDEERAQLDELRVRFDRERDQMDGIEARLAQEREELRLEREQLKGQSAAFDMQQLLEEEQKLKDASGPTSYAEEATQIVTDDQFIEVVQDDEDQLASEVSEIIDEGIDDFEPDATLISPLTTGLPNKFNDFKVLSERVVELQDRTIVAAAKLDRDLIELIFKEHTEFFVQLHMVDDYPIIGLCLANLDSKGNCTASMGWALDVKGIQHGKVLAKLEEEVSLRAGLYDLNGTLLRAVEIKAPLKSNITWIRSEAKHLADAAAGTFERASRKYMSQDFERVGSMRHNFEVGSFKAADSPAEAQLAAGIVGFWSGADRLKYLFANRSFSKTEFERIQMRVSKLAVETGICLGPELREVAVSHHLADDEAGLVELLTANFAEVCIGLRPNDLDVGSEWENWDALLGLGEELGIPPDPDVVELAEISLKRAQELAELDEAKAEQGPVAPPSTERTLIVAHRSESTGVTYFLPEDSVLDAFDDLAAMDRADLELMLQNESGRLEAAQVLIDRFGGAVIATVLQDSEDWSDREIAALAQFVESKASGFEGELVRCVEEGSPGSVYIAAYALTGIRSASAIPAILNALDDETKQGDIGRLAQTVAQYGERILPSLTRAIKRDGCKESFVELLASIETVHPGTLSSLSKDRSKVLRDAAREAREKRG